MLHPAPISDQLDWEVELAIVIGTPGATSPKSSAFEHVFGYTVANDVSVRDVQRRHGGQWFKGKNFDTHCPLGPWIVTADELGDPHTRRITLRVNGVTKQDSNTRFMVFRIPRIVKEFSTGARLEPGDVILTGTPEGRRLRPQAARVSERGRRHGGRDRRHRRAAQHGRSARPRLTEASDQTWSFRTSSASGGWCAAFSNWRAAAARGGRAHPGQRAARAVGWLQPGLGISGPRGRRARPRGTGTRSGPRTSDQFAWQDLYNAPLLVVCLSHKSAYLDRYAEPDKGWTDRDEARWSAPYWDIDTGMAAMLMLLTAVDAGLGALFFGVPARQDRHPAPDIRHSRATCTRSATVAIGYPKPHDPPSPSLKRGWRAHRRGRPPRPLVSRESHLHHAA